MSSSQTMQEKVVRSGVVAIILTFLGSVCAYLVRILYSHTLTIEDYGLFYATFALVNAATVYTDLGFGYSVAYFMPKYLKLKSYSKAWNIFIYGQVISLIMAVILSVIFAFFAPFLAKNYLKVTGSENLIYVFCIYLTAFAVINGLILIYSSLQKAKYYSSITLSRWLFTLIFSVFFFLFDLPNVIFYAAAWAFGHILTVGIFLYLLHANHSFLTNNKIVWEMKTFKLLLTMALPALAETVISIVIITDTFFLTLFKGVKEVGIYNIIYPLAFIPVILFSPINTLLLPMVSHLMEGEKHSLKYLLQKILEIIPFMGLYFALFLAISPSYIVSVVFGQKWSGLVEIPLTVLSVGTIAILLNGILGAVILGIGKVRERLKVAAAMAVIGVGLNAFLIWYYGVLGATVAISIAALIISAMYIKILKSSLNFSIPVLFYLKLLIFSITIYILVKYLNIQPSNWFEFIGFGFIYTIIFLLFGYLIKLIDKRLVGLLLGK